MYTRILFLDDSEWRHSEFRKLSRSEFVRVTHVYTAGEAIEELKLTAFDQVFLDHDLSEEDIMVSVLAESKVPTGMRVVDHILTMETPPPEVIVHSCNAPAAKAMHARLSEHKGIRLVQLFPFHLMFSHLTVRS